MAYILDQTTKSILDPQLREEEGYKKFLYKDTARSPKWTIGIGHNIEDNGLSDAAIKFIYEEDLFNAVMGAKAIFGDDVMEALSPARRAVVIDLSFNMGNKLLQFVNTIRAVKEARYDDAADGIKKSLWYSQVGTTRGDRLVRMMRNG